MVQMQMLRLSWKKTLVWRLAPFLASPYWQYYIHRQDKRQVVKEWMKRWKYNAVWERGSFNILGDACSFLSVIFRVDYFYFRTSLTVRTSTSFWTSSCWRTNYHSNYAKALFERISKQVILIIFYTKWYLNTGSWARYSFWCIISSTMRSIFVTIAMMLMSYSFSVFQYLSLSSLR